MKRYLFVFVGSLLAALMFASPAAAQDGDEWDDDKAWQEESENESPSSDEMKAPKAKPSKANKDTTPKKKKSPPKKKSSAATSRSDSDELPWRVGASVGFVSESAAVRDDTILDVSRSNNDFEYDVGIDPAVLIELWMPLSELFVANAGIRYAGVYTGTRENDEEYEFGHQVELHIGMEMWVDIFSSLDLILGARGALGVLFASGDLSEEVERQQDMGANAWSTPKLGFAVTPIVGARWELSENVAVRSALAFSFGRYFLFNNSAATRTVSVERSAVANFTRYELTVGIEFAL